MTLVWSFEHQKFGHFNDQRGVILTSKGRSLGRKKQCVLLVISVFNTYKMMLHGCHVRN